MKLLFLGTPEFAVPTLKKLAIEGPRHDLTLSGVICQPDRPAGRGGELRAPAVKQAAQALGLEIFQPERIRSDEAWAWLQAHPADALVVVAYGQIIPRRVFEQPRFGAINAHASLLPRYRGAAPIQRAIARGETRTGVTTMRIDAGLDTGDMLLRAELPIAADETAAELAPRLANLAAELMVETLLGLRQNSIVPQTQDGTLATLAPLLKKEDGGVDWRWSAGEIYNRWRGFQPWPGLFTEFRGQQLRLRRIRPAAGPIPGPPGACVAIAGGLGVACGEGSIELIEVQMEGRKQMPAVEFARGARLDFGRERLGAAPE